MTKQQTRTAPAADKCGCTCPKYQEGDCRQYHRANRKKLNYRGHWITATWHEPHLIEIGYQGHSGYIGVSRRGSNRMPYFYTMAEPEEKTNRLVEIPASNLMEAVGNGCAGLVNLRHRKPPPGEFD